MSGDLQTNEEPLYASSDLHPAYQLRYGWSAWASGMLFPQPPAANLFEELKAQWETDGLRVLESKWTGKLIQITFSTKPDVSPILLASRAKGRLEYFWRTRAKTPVKFSRKVAVRSIGDNTREEVERYIARQVSKARFADPRFARLMSKFTVVDPSVDLSQPTETNSGRYWYNLHVVLVVEERFWIFDEALLGAIGDCCCRVAAERGYRISVRSVMPDHVHLAVRGNVSESPEDMALALLNNLAVAMGQSRWWSGNYYAGTFSEYNLNAVRGRSGETCAPA
jgi:REP element-mobilizing transposase RayT